MGHLDLTLEDLDHTLVVELEDLYDVWLWHPGMG